LFELRYSRFQGFLRGSGEQPALVSAQIIHTIKNNLRFVYSSAAGSSKTDGDKTKRSYHRIP
jgi:hypothetical protein